MCRTGAAASALSLCDSVGDQVDCPVSLPAFIKTNAYCSSFFISQTATPARVLMCAEGLLFYNFAPSLLVELLCGVVAGMCLELVLSSSSADLLCFCCLDAVCVRHGL